ncbi:YdbH domain-containing protein [Sulfuriflexus mobilis]|uniref:YdbH domain-containing protein n=1 Tax=Sulfuriflexus mobilis TaxID=1811807 RepID=UPI0015593743|nr:YdbH domain-containing protein [Sulfuriflexus mobilis]
MIMLLSAFSGLLIMLIVSLPGIVERLVEHRLSKLGVDAARLQIAELGLKASRIRTLKFVYRGSGKRFAVTASDIQISYRLDELLFGRLGHIQLPRVAVRISALPGVRVDMPLPTIASIPLPAAWLPDLPFKQLTLTQLRLYDESSGGDAPVDMRADILVRGGRLQARLDLEAEGREPLHADLRLMPSGEMALLVSPAGAQPSYLSLTSGPLIDNGQRLQAQVAVEGDLQALQAAFSAWQVAGVVPTMRGHLKGQGQLSLPLAQDPHVPLAGLWLEGGASLDVEMPGVLGAVEGLRVALPLTIDLKEGLLHWHIEDGARVTFYPRLEAPSAMQTWLQARGRDGQRLPVIITAPGGVSGQARIDADFLAHPRLQTRDTLRLDYGEAGAAMDLHLSAQALDIGLRPPLQGRAMLTFAGSLLEAQPLPAKRAALTGTATLALREDRLMLALQPGTALSLDGFASAGFVAPSLTATLESPADCAYPLSPASWHCAPFALRLLLPTATLGDKTLQTGNTQLRLKTLAGTANGWSVQARGEMAAVSLHTGGHSVRLDSVQAAVQADQSGAKAQLTLSAAGGGINAHIDAVHRQADNRGQATFNIDPINFTPDRRLFARLFDGWPPALNLDKGRLLAGGRLNWRPETANKKGALSLDQTTRISLEDIGGAYQKTTFAGLSSAVMLRGVTSPRLETPATIRLATLNPGFPITDISLQAAMSVPLGGKPVFSINALQAQALGGQVAGDHIELDLARERNPFTIRVSGLDIGALLKLEQDKGLYGTGVIDGELPLVLDRDGLSMRQGRLVARAPGGVLRYAGDARVQALAQGNPNLQLLLTALRDFHYHLLQTDVNYAPDGSLTMQLRLEGKNPELEGGRPVHLNVNVEENVLMLLRSLRLADEISEKVGEGIQQREQGR